MTAMTPRPCADCGKAPCVDVGPYAQIVCDDYDGPSDEGTPTTPHSFCANGSTRDQAIAEWNEWMNEWEEEHK